MTKEKAIITQPKSEGTPLDDSKRVPFKTAQNQLSKTKSI